MALVYRQATRALECDRCRRTSHAADIGELESAGWQERGFAYHLCPQCTGQGHSDPDSSVWLRPDRAA